LGPGWDRDGRGQPRGRHRETLTHPPHDPTQLRDREDDALARATRAEAAFALLDKHTAAGLGGDGARADLDAAADAVATLHKLRRTAGDARDALAERRVSWEVAPFHCSVLVCGE